ncbi:MAG TPA: Ku protein [Candidatus Saccharimonadales bacterium]|nr:Ku protein [Candidatus Saccharimonadales bacterium]
MRPLWNGSISFGLVNIPVRLFSGATTREGLDLDMLHKEDKGPIRYARICRKDGDEVPWDDIVKGYEYRDGDYVVLTQKDFEKANPERTQTIDIQSFVDTSEIDIRYFEKPYYLEPVKGGEKAYALLRDALAATDKLALTTYVLHEREHLGVVQTIGKALVLVQMRFPADLREATQLKFPEGAASKKELDVAKAFITQETRHFVPEDYHDTYTEELESIIKAKVKGAKPSPAKHQAHKATEASDLMASLKASLKAKG